MKIGVLFSSGKDSTAAMHRVKGDIVCLISVVSENKDSFMYHTPSIKFAKHQSEALDIPIIFEKTTGVKEEELGALKKVLEKAIKEYEIEGVVTGALYSNYQRERIEKICGDLKLKVFSPLWHLDQEDYMREIIKEGFEFIFTKVAADGLDKGWLGRVITGEDVNKLVELNKKNGLNVAGEGGEFETFVLYAPLFKKELKISSSKIVEESKNCAELVIEDIIL